MNFEEWQYHESKLPKNSADKEKLMQELRIQLKAEILSNEKAHAWLANYNADSTDKFIDYYVTLKVNIINSSKYYIKLVEQVPELRYRKETEAVLDMILQKKLFNLQCQWRAEQITLPGIEICVDFGVWADDVRNCPFIDPITETEMELMRSFVKTNAELRNTDSFLDSYYSFQAYNKLADKEGLHEELPKWYSYYDDYLGTAHLLLLPDIRGAKEDYYFTICYEAAQKKQVQNTETKPYVPPPETLYYSLPRFYELACSSGEDAHFITLLAAIIDEDDQIRKMEEKEGEGLDVAMILNKLPNLPPVRGGLSWREALRCCYNDYVSSHIYNDLPVVWEQYLLYKSMNIQAPKKEKLLPSASKKLRKIYEKELLEGRKLAGEPQDLNF